ncbi:MAG: hypothetical protein ABI904_12835 [Chloroflexota bacterium]
MKKFFNVLFIVWILSLSLAMPAVAQGETPYIIRSTKPISDELRAQLDAWLAIDAPSSAHYYIVTYWKQKLGYMVVSLVGVDLASPDAAWTFTEDPSAWMGTVKVLADGSVSPLSVAMQAPLKVWAIPKLAAGGGSYVAFPWQAGTAVMYGPRGVHGDGDYGTSGLVAVDLVSGTDLGPSAANDGVYASDVGTVDYVCEDALTVAVRTHNETTGDYFVYAHMLANDNLDYDVNFARGELMGSLKHGSFNDTCGWAEQAPNHWHVHWMFEPASGSFRAEDCRLTVSTEKWDCSGKTVGTGQSIYGGGGFGSASQSASGLGTAGSGIADTQATFWDYLLGGMIFMFDKLFVEQLPEHTSAKFVYVMYNAVEIVFRLSRVLVYQSINIAPLVDAIKFVIGLNLAMSGIHIIIWCIRTFKALKLI